MNTQLLLAKVSNERAEQDNTWGVQNHTSYKWMSILMEEVGEASKATLEGNTSSYCDELIHVAAVAIAAIESLYRQSTPMPEEP